MGLQPGNPIVGGVELRTPAIQSPNFVTGVSGWQVNIDGSAEFNNLTVRGTFKGTDFIINADGFFFYSGTPGSGNLFFAVAPSSGTDAFGNAYVQGVNAGTLSGRHIVIDALGDILLYNSPDVNVARWSTGDGSLRFYNTSGAGAGNLLVTVSPAGGSDTFGNSYQAGLNVTKGTISGTTFKGTDFIINKDGIFFYSGTPGSGNLDLSVATNSGTDTFGNAYPAGVNIEPDVRNMPSMINGWSIGGHATYALDPIGNLVVSWKDLQPGTDTDGTAIWANGALPSRFRPPDTRRVACYCDQPREDGSGRTEGAALELQSDGSVNCYGISAGAFRVDLFAVIPITF